MPALIFKTPLSQIPPVGHCLHSFQFLCNAYCPDKHLWHAELFFNGN